MNDYFADANGTTKEDARGMQAEMAAADALEARVKAIADEIAHDDQLSVWSEEMQCRPDLEDFVDCLGPDHTYDDGVQCHHAFKAAIRELAEKVIERILANPKLVQ